MADYKTGETTVSNSDEQTPESWMNRLLHSDDAALGLNSGEDKGLLGNLMEMFMMLLMLAMQIEGKSKGHQMQAVSDALVNRRIDISSMVPNMQAASLSITGNGKVILSVHDGKQEYSHELTEAERNNISQVLHSDSDDQTKQQRLCGIVSAITYAHQAASNYERIDAERQSQEHTLQRK